MAPEIITLQLGQYANYVGAHLWNLQDEAIASTQLDDWSSVATSLDHEVLCSWSEDQHGTAVYSPRTVVVDLSGALGGVSFSTDVCDAAAAASLASSTWSGAVQAQHVGKALKSKFRQQLEAAGQLDTDDEAALAAQQLALEAAALALHEEQQPKYWTDYLQVDLHPSTVFTLPGVWHGLSAWDGWGPAPDTSSSRETAEAAVDKVRWWAEQCDKLQGLQVFADDLGGWGGFGHSIVQQLREDYPSQPLLYFSLQEPQRQRPDTGGNAAGITSASNRRLLSQSISVSELTQLASLYVPLTPRMQGLGSMDNSFQTAALLAAAIDTATLPLRCTAAGAAVGATDLHSLCHLLAGPAANLAALSLQLPTSQLHSSNSGAASSAAAAATQGLSLLSSSSFLLTAGVRLGAEQCLAEMLTFRGAQTASGLVSCSQAKTALDALLLQRQQEVNAVPCISHTCISPMPVALPLSFPKWLGASPAATSSSSHVTAAAPNPQITRAGQAAAQAPSALSRLTATSSFEGMLDGLHRSMQRLAPSAVGRSCFEEWGYSSGDADELQEVLVQLAGRYSTVDDL